MPNELSNSVFYYAMFVFLDKLWEDNKNEFDDNLPVLLGSMALAKDGKPIDKALWEDWINYAPHDKKPLTEEIGFKMMLLFLNQYRKQGESGEISRLIHLISSGSNDIRMKWQTAVKKALSID